MKQNVFHTVAFGTLLASSLTLSAAPAQQPTNQQGSAQDVQQYDKTIKGDVKNRQWLESETTRLRTETRNVDAALAKARASNDQAKVAQLEKEHEQITRQLATREKELASLRKNTSNEVKERQEQEKQAGDTSQQPH